MSVKETLRTRRAEEAKAAAMADMASEETGEVNNVKNEQKETTNMDNAINTANSLVASGDFDEFAALTTAEFITETPAADSATPGENISGPFIGQVNEIEVDNELRKTKADVVIISGERTYQKFVVIDAVLDLFNPRLVILGELNTPVERRARQWALSRGREFIAVPVQWGEGADRDVTAGPRRNHHVLKMATDMIASKGVRIAILTFEGAAYDPAVRSMVTVAKERNQIYKQDRELLKFVIPTVNGEAYLDVDALESGAGIYIGNGEYKEMPQPTVMIGARQAGGPNF